jgi:hypothetical protein
LPPGGGTKAPAATGSARVIFVLGIEKDLSSAQPVAASSGVDVRISAARNPRNGLKELDIS